MELDDFARVIGYLTMGWWVLMIILILIIFAIGKSTTTRETIAEYISPRYYYGGCRRADGKLCGR